MLHEFVLANREELVTRARALVRTRVAPRSLPVEVEEGLPLFLIHLAESLRTRGIRSRVQERDRKEVAARHGGALLRRGFTLAQVVHDYGAVCQAITELASERLEPIAAEEFASLNLYLDEAIGDAVTEFQRVREQILGCQDRERLGTLAQELGNLISTAMISCDLNRSGTVPVPGSSSAVHSRALRALQVLADRSLTEIRIGNGAVVTVPLRLADVLREIEAAAVVDAGCRSLSLTVSPVPRELEVSADRQLLASALTNLLQNAFEFSPPGGHVMLRAHAPAGKPGWVRIEVEDTCGGLPAGKAAELFPPCERRGANRSGLGTGLQISRKAVEAIGGRLSARDLPGVGCIFTVDLPSPLHGTFGPDRDEKPRKQ